MTLHRTPASRGRLWPLAIALVALAASLTIATTAQDASAAGRTLNVNPVSGKDTNAATAAAPLKTLTKALKLAQSGDTVELAGGGYGPATSGEQYPASGLVVPAGVTIQGTLDSGFPVSTLTGPGSGVALTFAGDATVRNLALGGQGFGVGLHAKQGTQALSNVALSTGRSRVAVIDGLSRNAGILLSGTAQATVTGGTIFLGGGAGIDATQQARFTLRGGEIQLTGEGAGVQLRGQARFTADGAKIRRSASDCVSTASGIIADGGAHVTLTNSAQLENVLGFGLLVRDTATATLNGATITRDNSAGCDARASVTLVNRASLVADGVAISTEGPGGEGIDARDLATATLKDAFVRTEGFVGIELDGSNTLNLQGGIIGPNGIGIRARPQSPAGPDGPKPNPRIRLTGTTVTGNAIGIQVDQPILKLRGTRVASNSIGIEILGAVQGLPTQDGCAFPCVDLGTVTDPGRNTFVSNANTGVRFRSNSFKGITGLTAVGNVWAANAQGSNGEGRYVAPLTVVSRDPLAIGPNFELPADNAVHMQLGPGIGGLRLAPSLLRARTGRTARLRMSWTHPRAWRRLRSMQLRVYDGRKQVATIGVRPRGGRLSARGAVGLAAGRSRVTHRGRTVTARLALRLSPSLAGRNLRLDVRAVDRRGADQLTFGAGRIRVTR